MANTGVLNFSTAANVDDSTGSAWTTVNNALADGSGATTVVLTDGGHSDYCKVTNPGSHGIPSGSTIDGIQFDIQRNASLNGVDDQITDRHVYVVVGGTIQTTWADRKSATVWPTSETNKTYGGATDKWSNPGTWADTDFGSTFGVVISVNATATVSNTASIDLITCTIYYTAPAGHPAGRRQGVATMILRPRGHDGQFIF